MNSLIIQVVISVQFMKFTAKLFYIACLLIYFSDI